jgi:hypothetical protein
MPAPSVSAVQYSAGIDWMQRAAAGGFVTQFLGLTRFATALVSTPPCRALADEHGKSVFTSAKGRLFALLQALNSEPRMSAALFWLLTAVSFLQVLSPAIQTPLLPLCPPAAASCLPSLQGYVQNA